MVTPAALGPATYTQTQIMERNTNTWAGMVCDGVIIIIAMRGLCFGCCLWYGLLASACREHLRVRWGFQHLVCVSCLLAYPLFVRAGEEEAHALL